MNSLVVILTLIIIMLLFDVSMFNYFKPLMWITFDDNLLFYVVIL